MATPFPSIAVDQSSSRTTTRNMIEVTFDGGYEQSVPRGINYRRDKWNIAWTGLNVTERNTIVSFIDAVSNGSVITWQSPYDVSTKRYRLDGDWSISDTGGNIYTIQIALRQIFDAVG